jgi:hypothetical protein
MARSYQVLPAIRACLCKNARHRNKFMLRG